VALAVMLGSVALWWRHEVSVRHVAMLRADPERTLTDPVLRERALADGRAVFVAHCAACHGAAGRGDPRRAMPDLTDREFLFGEGKVGEIEQIVLHGIRAGDTKGWNLAEMPGFAKAVPYAREKLPSLTPAQVGDLVGFLRAANGAVGTGGGTGAARGGGYDPARVERGRRLFTTNGACWDCHGGDGAGDAAIGAPNLVDGLWLKGTGSEADIADTIEHGLAGVSPAFAHRISAYDARVVAAYTASLHPAPRPLHPVLR